MEHREKNQKIRDLLKSYRLSLRFSLEEWGNPLRQFSFEVQLKISHQHRQKFPFSLYLECTLFSESPSLVRAKKTSKIGRYRAEDYL